MNPGDTAANQVFSAYESALCQASAALQLWSSGENLDKLVWSGTSLEALANSACGVLWTMNLKCFVGLR